MKINSKVLLIFFISMIFPFVLFQNVYSQESVPNWIKTNAQWWHQETIDDDTFLNAISFLIDESIIKISAVNPVSPTSDESVPDWVKNVAGWWSQDAINEKEFLQAIEFLVNQNIIKIKNNIDVKTLDLSNYNCDQNEDANRDGIPDLIDNMPKLTGLTNVEINEKNLVTDIEGRDWSNCHLSGDFSHYTFREMNLAYADFTDSTMFATTFSSSNLTGADFSNLDMKITNFFKSDLSHANFKNSDFTMDNWEDPYIIFKLTKISNTDEFKKTYSCSFNPCQYREMMAKEVHDSIPIDQTTFREDNIPLNVDIIDAVFDGDDNRVIGRLNSAFYWTNFERANFANTDLSYTIFNNVNGTNVDFSGANLSHAQLTNVDVDAKFTDAILTDTILSDYNKDGNSEIVNDEKLVLDMNDFKIIFDHAKDLPPINWSMGMTIYQDKLYVADTDNHRIVKIDLNGKEPALTITSPISGSGKYHNLPTSIAIGDEKMFVAYGFEDNIQVFDFDGNYLWQFGDTGTKEGQFDTPHRIFASNERLFVADSRNQRIQIFDLDGNFLKQFGVKGDSRGKFLVPISLHVYENEIYVSDLERDHILVFNLQGIFLREFPVNQLNTSEPWGVFVFDDFVFVSDVEDFTVKIFDKDGRFIKKFGEYGDRYGQFKYPIYTVTDGKKIYVSDAYNYRIQVFSITS